MEHLKAASGRLSAVVVTRLVLIIILSGILRLSNGEINTACTTSSALTTFTPCFNYLTGSRSSPTEECCDTLKSAMSDSMDCACLIVTGNVPVSIPFVRTLALSLPKQCNSGVPVQCKATGVPLPPPGPAILSPPQTPPSYYPPPRSPSPQAHAATPRSQRAAALSVVKTVKPTSTAEPAPTSAVEPTPTEKPATAPPPLFVPKATPADIRPVIDHTQTSDANSSSPSILLLFFAFLYMFLC